MKTIEKHETRRSAPVSSRKLLQAWPMPETRDPESPKGQYSLKPFDIHQMSGPLTTIAAEVNVGFGNTLFIRGEGEGLSWDKGVPLRCAGDSTWLWASTDIRQRATFKLLMNDVVWAQGDNLIVEAGKDI